MGVVLEGWDGVGVIPPLADPPPAPLLGGPAWGMEVTLGSGDPAVWGTEVTLGLRETVEWGVEVTLGLGDLMV